jgi:hypothetical protein
MIKDKDTKDRDVKTMSVPSAGKLYYGLGRNGSYEAAKRGRNSRDQSRRSIARAGDRYGAETLGGQMKPGDRSSRSQGARNNASTQPKPRKQMRLRRRAARELRSKPTSL